MVTGDFAAHFLYLCCCSIVAMESRPQDCSGTSGSAVKDRMTVNRLQEICWLSQDSIWRVYGQFWTCDLGSLAKGLRSDGLTFRAIYYGFIISVLLRDPVIDPSCWMHIAEVIFAAVRVTETIEVLNQWWVVGVSAYKKSPHDVSGCRNVGLPKWIVVSQHTSQMHQKAGNSSKALQNKPMAFWDTIGPGALWRRPKQSRLTTQWLFPPIIPIFTADLAA